MALVAEAWRLAENDEFAEYAYGPARTMPHGRLRFNKASGETELIEVAPGDERVLLFERVSWKLMHAWKSGALPEGVHWAS